MTTQPTQTIQEIEINKAVKDHEVAIAQLNADNSADAMSIEQMKAQMESLEAKTQTEY